MKIRYILCLMSFAAFQGVQAKNEKVLADIVRTEWLKSDAAITKAYFVDWHKIFKTVDQNGINVAKFRCSFVEGEKPTSLLSFAIAIARLGSDYQDNEKRAQGAERAIKTLLEKYLKNNPCAGEDCNMLVMQCLSGIEDHPNLKIVDMLLKHGARVNEATKNAIRTAYQDEGSPAKEFPHIKAFLAK